MNTVEEVQREMAALRSELKKHIAENLVGSFALGAALEAACKENEAGSLRSLPDTVLLTVANICCLQLSLLIAEVMQAKKAERN